MSLIRLKVALPYLLLIMVFGSVFSFLFVTSQMDLLLENLNLQAALSAEAQYTQIQTLLAQRDSTLDTVITALGALAPRDVIVLNAAGTIYYSRSGNFAPDAATISAAWKTALRHKSTADRYFLQVDKNTLQVNITIPFTLSAEPQPFLYYETFSMPSIQEQREKIYLSLWSLIFLFLSSHLLFAFSLNAMLIRPLKIISDTTFALSCGSLDTRIELPQKDEIGRLGDNLNRMADAMQEKISTLARKNNIMTQELIMASKVQQVIYPKSKVVGRLEIWAYHKPLFEVSGDFHDIIPLKAGCGILVADVAGHGVSAALITMRIKEIVRSSGEKQENTRDLICFLNTELDGLLENYSIYFTAFYLIIKDTGHISFTNAGHHRGYLYRPQSRSMQPLDTEGTIIGMSLDSNKLFKVKQDRVASGDKIVLFTDGIVETRNKDNLEYGHNRLVEALRQSENLHGQATLNSLIGSLNRFCADCPQKDDQTMLVIEIK